MLAVLSTSTRVNGNYDQFPHYSYLLKFRNISFKLEIAYLPQIHNENVGNVRNAVISLSMSKHPDIVRTRSRILLFFYFSIMESFLLYGGDGAS